MKKLLTLGIVTLITLSLSGCSFVYDIGQLYKDSLLYNNSKTQHEDPYTDFNASPDAPPKDNLNKDDYISDLLNVTVSRCQVSSVIYNDPSGHRIGTFINMDTNEYIDFDLDAVEDNYSQAFPQHYLDYASHLDFVIYHQGNKILTWEAYIRDTQELVNNYDKETLAKILRLNPEFEDYAYLIPIEAPDTIHLSEWPQNEFVCFKLPQKENGKHFIPPIINDSFSHVGRVHFSYFTPEYRNPIDDEYHINIRMWEPTYREIDEHYIVFSWTSVPTSEVLSSHNLVYLSNYALNDIVSVHFNHYFYNDTNNTVQLSSLSGDRHITVPPDYIGEITWTLDNVVVTKIS